MLVLSGREKTYIYIIYHGTENISVRTFSFWQLHRSSRNDLNLLTMDTILDAANQLQDCRRSD